MKRKIARALFSVLAAAAIVVGVQSPARAETDPKYCVVEIHLAGGWGCFIRNGDNWIASDKQGDGMHVEVTWKVRNSSGKLYGGGICSAYYGYTIVCFNDYDRGDDVNFGVGIYKGDTYQYGTGWSGWISVGS